MCSTAHEATLMPSGRGGTWGSLSIQETLVFLDYVELQAMATCQLQSASCVGYKV